jgi:hypothetical protein
MKALYYLFNSNTKNYSLKEFKTKTCELDIIGIIQPRISTTAINVEKQDICCTKIKVIAKYI